MRHNLILVTTILTLAGCGFTNEAVRTEKGITTKGSVPASQPHPQPPPPPPPPGSPVPPPSTASSTGTSDPTMQLLRQKFAAATPATRDQLLNGGSYWGCNGRVIQSGELANQTDSYHFSTVDDLLYVYVDGNNIPVISSGSTLVAQTSTNDYYRITASGALIWESDVAQSSTNATQAALADPTLMIAGYWLCGK